MNIYSKSAAALTVIYALSAPVLASDFECKSGSKSGWMPREGIVKSLVAKGYEIRKIEVEGGCYEIYALRDGKRLEIFVNPATGLIEKIKEK